MGRRELLTFAMERANARLCERLVGLTNDEFFWKPVPDAWTIHQDPSGRWTYDYAIPDPVPAPSTTIAWQVTHLATTRLMYHEWAYGPARLTFPEILIASDVADAVDFLDEGYLLLKEDLDGETEEGLDVPKKTNWGDEWPAWRIFTVMADHDALHTGLIGSLRDLYHWTTRS